MAIVYVDSAAGGANNGTSWTDAYTSIASTTGVAAGTEIRVDDGHVQRPAASTSHAWSNGTIINPILILCVDKATDNLSSGAVVGVSSAGKYNLTLNGGVVVSGITFESSDDFIIGSTSTGKKLTFVNCTFLYNSVQAGTRDVLLGQDALTRSILQFTNCTFDYATSGNPGTFQLQRNTTVILTGCAFTGASGTFATTQGSNDGLRELVCLGCDLSTWDTLMAWTALRCTALMRGCLLKSGYAASSGTLSIDGSWLLLESCEVGTLSASPLGLTYRDTYRGLITSTLAVYRTGGADDDENANEHSWKMVSNANALEQVSWLESEPFWRWVAAGSYTVTVYVGSGVTLQDDEFWIEVLSPSEAGSPTAQALYQSTRLAYRGTAANLASDGTSTWNGSYGGTAQKVSVSIAPAVAGPVIVRACLAKASTTVYVDPQINTAGAAGKSRYVLGSQAFDETEAGGGGQICIVVPTIHV